MRWLVNWGKQTRVVRGGQTMRERCPECGEDAVFREVEQTEKVGLFFVSVAESTERAFQCGACGDLFDLKDTEAKPAAPAPRPAPAPKPAPIDHGRVEDELAAIKAKLGR